MIWHIRPAVIAIALFVLGMSGPGVSAASLLPPAAVSSPPLADAPAETSRVHLLDIFTATDGAGPSAAPGAGTGNAFTGEDNGGDDGSGTTGAAIGPHDDSFAAAFVKSQDFSRRSFLAPPTTGPPAA